MASVADISVAWNVFLHFSTRIEHCLSFYYLIHAVDTIIVFLQTGDLSSKECDLSLLVLCSHPQVVALVDEFGVLVLVPLEVSLLVLDVPPQSGALAVPEVDLVPVLPRRLFKQVDLLLQLLLVEVPLPHHRLQLLDALSERPFIGIVSRSHLSHARLLSLQAVLLHRHLCHSIL